MAARIFGVRSLDSNRGVISFRRRDFQTGCKPGSRNVTEQPIVVTGTIITATEEGAAANYQPAKTLVVREDRSNTPGSYVLNGPGHVVNKNGEVIRTAIKPGTHVRVYYVNAGDLRMVDHVVVD